ncbi:MAG: hypothetical protein H8D45_24005 [Bacteroidetes bacterium]|nr:hypothetical protein [Bacteroidota bacterium]MBL7102828.1 hypothetical protein [Bacteroidales bacterium]
MDDNIQQKGTGRLLRQKIINLMYLIFIVLAFLYIPSNFIDVFKDINYNYEKSTQEFNNEFTSNQLNNLYNFNSLLFNYLTENPVDSVQIIKQDFNTINQSSTILIQKIEDIKHKLAKNCGGYNEYGYLLNSQNYSGTEKYLLENNLADSIHYLLKNHKNMIKPLVGKKCFAIIDSVLPVKETIINSSGEPKKWALYYFNKMPVSGAISVLSKFQNDVRRVDNIVIESYINDFIIKNDSLSVEVYNKDFSAIRAYVEKDNRIDSLTIDFTGKIKFFPYEEGKYEFTIYDSKRKYLKTYFVKDIGPILQRLQFPVVFTGIDNILKIHHSKFCSDNIKITTTEGTITREGSKFLLRAKSPGLTTIKVFGIDNNEEKLLTTERYLIEDLPDLKAYIDNKNNGYIKASVLRNQKEIKVKSNIIRDISFKLKGFNIKRIHNHNYKNSIEFETNVGSKFNSTTQEILNKAIEGDIYIFDNIVVKNFDEKEMDVPPIVLTVK